MSGHSKWANIKNKKAKTDAAKGKVFTKIGRELAVAAKGGTDPALNSKLADVIAKAQNMGLDMNELISFASVIQAEAFTKESMQYISSVFWNRLNSDYKRFESDPTTTYAKSLSELAHYREAMKNAYDTYKCVGTPVGPINCPGMDTINAVVNPADTDYFYFITDSEDNFYYNKTYAEHVADCYATGLWKR